MEELSYLLLQLGFSLPAVATLIVGGVLVWRRRERLAPRARSLGVAGIAVLLAGGLANAAYVGLLPSIIHDGDWRDTQIVLTAVNLTFLVLHVLGLALLIAALLATARPPLEAWDQPYQPVQPGDQPPGDQLPPGAGPRTDIG